MDGDMVALIATFISFQLSQTALILYKIGRLESKLEEFSRRLMVVERVVGLNGR